MISSPFNAYVIRCHLSGQPIDGDLANLSPECKPLFEALDATPLKGRPEFIDCYLKEHPNLEYIIQALTDADPTGPAPPIAPPQSDWPAIRLGETPPAESVVKLTCAAGIAPRDVEFLWPGRVPLGMLTLFAGDPKLGKSYVTLAMAADVSRGAALPGSDNPEGPGSVIIMSVEDDRARTIVPRLNAHGADVTKIHILESVYLQNGNEALPSSRDDIVQIEHAAAGLRDCRLIIIDPVSAYLGGVDDQKNAELLGVLSPLKVTAERLNMAVVLVSHFSESGGSNGKHQVIGSIAYVGACRANFAFVRDRTDPASRRVLMLDNGGNIAPAAPTLAYIIDDRGDGPRVEWFDEPIAITADEALAADVATGENVEKAVEHRECDRWLRETLASDPMLAADVVRVGADAGFTRTELKRAKIRFGATTRRKGFGPGSKCYWCSCDPGI